MAEATSRDPFSNIPIDDFSNLSLDHTGGHVQSHMEQYPHGQQYGLYQQKQQQQQQQQQQQYPEQQSAFVSYGHHNNTVNQTYRNGVFNGAAPHNIQYSDPQSYIANYTHTQNPYVTSQTINANSIQYPCGSSKIECLSQSVTRILPAQAYQRQHQDVPQPQPKYHDHHCHQVQLVPQTAANFSRIQQQRPIQPTYQISLVEQQQQAQLINFSTVSSITASQTTSKPAADVEQHYHSWYVEDDLSSIDSPPLSKEDSVDKNASPEMTAVSSSGGSSADDTEKTPGGNKKRSSYRTQSTFTSYYCESPLDKATFAPPPSHPLTAIPKTKLPYLQRSESAVQDSSNFPIFSKITHSGHLSARLSAKSLILKKWKSVFWIAYGDCELFMFRSRADFDEWVTNPYMTKQERNEIVKLRVNFRKGANDNLGVRCYRASHMRSKDYGKSGNMLMFKLEQWMHHGPIVIGAFASSSKPEIGAFNIICNAMIDRQEYGLKHLVAEGRDDISNNLLLNYYKRERS